MTQPARPMNPLDRRILAALHVDARASWRTVALALNEPERTVARRATQLLSSGRLEVRAVSDPFRTGRSAQFLIRAKGVSGGAWTTASSLAQRPEVQFVHLISGGPDTVALAWCPANRVVDLLAHELAQVPGNASMTSMPVVRYFRTLHDWEPGILSEQEIQQLRSVQPVSPWPSPDPAPALSRSDHRLIDALRKDGRCSFEELGRLAGVSEQTAARRVKQLREDGTVAVRAVVDPAELGLPVGVILWLRAKPSRLNALVRQLQDLPGLRFAAGLIGEFSLVADVRLANLTLLHELLSQSEWLEDVDRLESSTILRTLKHSDVLVAALRTPSLSEAM